MPDPHLLQHRHGLEVLYHDNQDGTFSIEHRQDVEAVLDTNKAMATHNDGYSPSRELRRVAHIPDVVIAKWLTEEGLDVFNPDHADRLNAKLNDSEWLYLRTAPGRL